MSTTRAPEHARQAPDGPALLRARLKVDPEWSVDLPRGFAWWAHDLRQTVIAEPRPQGINNDHERAGSLATMSCH